jgi:hypothetical protein
LAVWFLNRRPKLTSNPFGYRRDGPAPRSRSFRQPNRKRSQKAAIAIALLGKPPSAQGLARKPVQEVGVNLRPDRFHEVAGEAITGVGVNVQESDSRIETHCSGGEASFRF